MSAVDQTYTWRGWWIWGSGDIPPHHRNEYIYARKTFTVPGPVRSARVRVTADTRYQLYVNGELVARGPARCIPEHQAFDELDLSPYVRRGRNVIAACAYHVGESTFQSLERGGWGFLLDGEVVCVGGRRVALHTDPTWKARRADAYNRKTSRYSVQLAFQEDFDAAKDEPRWTDPRFDDRRWPQACVYGQAYTMPYLAYEPRGIPHERETDCEFAAVGAIMTGRCGPDYQRADNIGVLMADEKRRRATGRVFDDPDAAIRARGAMTVRPTPAGCFAAIVLDAGREVSGYLTLDVEAAGGEIIDFFYCEHVRPNGDAVLRARAGGMCPMADRYRCRPGRQQHTFFSWKGFRYVLAVFRDVRRPMKVRRLAYRFTSYPVEPRGAFACSDPLLDRVWQVGAYTQQLCMHDAYMDCPWREQAQWWGDARVQWRVNQAAFGDAALFRRGLRQAAQSQNPYGLTYGLFPCEAHGCILPDYVLVWITSIWDYYWYAGDDAPIAEHFADVKRALAWFEGQVAEPGLLRYPGPGLWLFLDWSPLHKGECNATYNMQYLEALRIATAMARRLRDRAAVARYSSLATRLERAILRAFWDERRKVFYEGYLWRKHKPFPQIAQHGNSYAILTDLQRRWHGAIADKGIVSILDRHDELFAKNTFGNAWQKGADRPIASSFFYAYVLEALFKAGRPDAAMRAIRTLWPRMLDDGATTWYESWNHGPDVYGGSSACHAWSASPTYHLSEQVGGVRPTAPGFDRVAIAPRSFDLDWAGVTTPTRHGPIRVEWRRRDGAIDGTIRLPKGVTADVDWFGRSRTLRTPGVHKLST